ncbi:MAG TPA: VgrG-related protein [Frankiaceae bacterium]|nr:VgrG-related protein [Frankiaceae bacterium]
MTAPAVSVGGTPLTAAQAGLVRAVTVDAALNLPAVATVELDDPAGTALATVGATIGATLTVACGATTLFTGDVTGLECRYDGAGQVAVVVAYDAAYRLRRHHATTAYPQQSYAEILGAVARAAGVGVGTLDVPGTPLPFRERVAEDGWSFVLRLAAEVDRDVVVRDGALCVVARTAASSAPDASALTSADPRALHVGDGRLLRLRVAAAGNDQISSTTVRGWDPTTKKEVVATAQAPGTYPGAQPGGAAPASTAAKLGTADVTIPAPGVTTSDLATSLARSAASRAGSRIAEVEAEVLGTPELLPGVTFAVGGAGAALNGSYTATEVRHVFDRDTGYRTYVRVGDRPRPADQGGPGGGVVPAVVVDNNDSEGGLGRVKVRFDWLDATYVSDWIRVLQPGAGNASGFQVVPEVGDEVLVGFAGGVPRVPYVLGALFNGVDLPKDGWPTVVADGKVVRRAFTSRTGHRLTFVDEDGDKGTVTIATGDASTSIELSQGQKGVTVTSTHDVSVTSKGKVTVAADGDVAVTSKQAVSVTATGGLTLKGATVKVEATGALELKGTNVTVNGTAAVKVAGGVVQLN